MIHQMYLVRRPELNAYFLAPSILIKHMNLKKSLNYVPVFHKKFIIVIF